MNDAEIRADLCGIATRILRDPVAAEDVAQEAFVRFHSHKETIVRPDHWLRRVTRNLALDQRRRRAEVPLPELAAEAIAVPDGTERVAGWLRGFVTALPEPYRDAVQLVDLDGRSQAEYAQDRGLSASGARTRVQRGRRMLQERVLACCRVRFEHGEVVDTGGCEQC